MCPDRELLSAWVDDEVPSPWREKLEKHVGECRACSAYASDLRAYRASVQAETSSATSAAEAAKDRVWSKLSAWAPAKIPAREPIWTRRFALPMPALAAAAAVVVALSFALASSNARNAKLLFALRGAAETQSIAVSQLATSGLGMESLIDYIGKQNAAVNIIIPLPKSAFGEGEPVIVREADWNEGSGR